VAELGTDMSRFPSAAHAASWAGLAPSQHESAGKRKSTRIRDGNRYLRAALTQASWAAVKQADTFLAAFYRRLAARRGKKKAIVAVAHKILVIVYTLLNSGQVYQEHGATALDERQKDRIVHRLERRIAQLGYKVHLEPVTTVAA
jgi:transposase